MERVKAERNLRVKELERKIDKALSIQALINRSLEELQAELEGVKKELEEI